MKQRHRSALCAGSGGSAGFRCALFWHRAAIRAGSLCVGALAALLWLADGAKAASVGPAGYTNAFASQPSSLDWATTTRSGSATDVYDMDAEVNANITASTVASTTTFSSTDPPAAGGTANWCSPGQYLQTRPTSVRYVPLMGKFVNNTGTNAAQIGISYDFTIAAGGVPEENGMGMRLYYSLTGLANSWTNLAALNTTASVNGRTTFSTNVTLTWPIGANLYLLWADDNSSGAGTDSGDQIDNFSLRVTRAVPPPLACTLNAPANNAAFATGVDPLISAATVLNGTMPYTVEYFTNSGAGNTIFASAGTSVTPPFNVTLAPLPAGVYHIYAAATDSAGSPARTNSTTNTFFVADPIVAALTAPADDATFDNLTSVTATAMVSGGTSPYSVRFFVDDLPNGAAVASPPYQRNLGALFVGDHAIKATVTDARGWVSNSLIRTVHITGPLGVALMPTNRASFNFGQSITLNAAPGGGTGPYTVMFYTNGTWIATLSSPPFTTNLGMLPVGSYTSYVQAADSSVPTMQMANSTTNVFTIVTNPLVATVASPTNGQFVLANQPLTLTATGAVGAPVTISSVEFFLDGVSVGLDSAAPFSVSVVIPAAGPHAIFALATDSLGRQKYSATNQVTALPPFSNDNFANAIPLTGVFVTTNGNNLGATREAGEPFIGGNSGGSSVWWTWTAPEAGLVFVDTFGSSFDTILGIYTGTSVSSLSTFTTSDNYTNLQSRVSFTATAGTVYRIVVDGSAGVQGNIVLHVQGPNGLSINTPANGAVFTLGDPIPFTVSFIPSFPNQPVTRVDFYRAGVRFATSTNSPFTAINTNSPIGTNSYYIIAYDSTGRGYQSGNRSLFVQNIGVTLLTPTDGNTYLNPVSIAVTAWGYLPSGTITNIEFLVDGVKFAEDNTAPYSAAWTNITSGTHRFTAVGTSDTGDAYVSNPINIGVYATFLPVGSIWKYLDNGSNQGTNWTSLNFDDSSWASGPSPLGYNNPQGRKLGTTNSFGPDPNNKYITTYYRQAFVVTNIPSYSFLEPLFQRDDGIVIYLNGVEIYRDTMPSGAINYKTLASTAAIDDGQNTYGFIPNRALFIEGTNVMAAEVHQSATNTPDCWFELYMYGIPVVVRNQSPLVSIINPTNGYSTLAPAFLTLEASASDPDGTVTKVEFFSDGIKIGEATSFPYTVAWASPPVGGHLLTAVATDNQAATTTSAQVQVVVYDSLGTPLVQITSLTNGATMEGPTNLLITAAASAFNGVTNVQFLANGVEIGNDPAAPYSVVWHSMFLSNGLVAVASDANGLRGTSAVVSVFITIPPTNTVAPAIAARSPATGSTVGSLTSISVTFSERVQNVDAADLRINGASATGLTATPGGSNFVFTFPQPPFGPVAISWAATHGITDFGFPSVLPFDHTGTGATWSYLLADLAPPVVFARVPAAGATVTNLTQATVTFSEPVAGVDAADLLVNGTPAFGLGGGGSNYTFSFSQPPGGTVAFSWANGHGITDLAASPNPFNGAAAGWNVTLDNRTILVQSNSTWRFIKGLAEASNPTTAWRQTAFDDSGWSNAFAPFFYGDPYSSGLTDFTLLSDMQGGYTSIYLRRHFNVLGAAAISNLFFNAQSDDGFIAWINGSEVLRYNMAAGETPYNGVASSTVNEPNNTGAAYLLYTLNTAGLLLEGDNVIAVHAFNQSLSASTDFGFNAQLYGYAPDVGFLPPRVAGVFPPAGEVFYFTNLTVQFTEPVSGVIDEDFLVNGLAIASLTSTTNTTYTFGFPQPPFGPVAISWATGIGIVDFDTPPRAFDSAAPGATFHYTLVNPSAPTIVSQTPSAGSTVGSLTQIAVVFSEPVVNVNAGDLLVNGIAATGLSGSGASYTFTFPQPAYGAVSIGWAAGHGITDVESAANAFDGTRQGNVWSYSLVDQIAPIIALLSPPASSVVTNLTQVTVTFSEPVTGVNASDLRVNGVPCTGVSGANATYTFTFTQPNGTIINFTWSPAHGISDLAATPNAFDQNGPGAAWHYLTPDTVAPILNAIDPPAGVTVRSLTRIRVTFTEPVTGVSAGDLLIDGSPVLSVSGSDAGPYTFSFPPPTNGPVTVRWAAGHAITDLATPPNPYAGGQWNYMLDPNANVAGTVVINEIMFDSLNGTPAEEWIELHNVTSALINLTGWRLTKGVNFTFPEVSIPAGGFLVVAADVATFQSNYPAVMGVVGGWSGTLNNNDETIELKTALGETACSVHYATEGDWARRERGGGAARITNLTRSGATATATSFSHGYTANDVVIVTGAAQPEYNGRFTVTSVTPSTFSYTISGAPVTPATGNPIAHLVTDNGSSGWAWYSAASGNGSSLELVNPYFDYTTGENWLPSANLGGTPGQANSVLSTNVAPLIQEVTHFPPVPKSTDSVTISARVKDELSNGVGGVTLFYRDHATTAPGSFLSAPMLDDGAHSDGDAGDGLYAAVLPAAANGTIVEFYVQATDTTGHTRTWPAPVLETNAVGALYGTLVQGANCLYQVDNEVNTNNMPMVRAVMTATERSAFPPGDRSSDAAYNLTFIYTSPGGTDVRYRCDARVRGAGTRTRTPTNNRLNIPNDNRWNGRAAFNLNSQFVHAQLIGSVAAEKAGLVAEQPFVVQYRINAVNPAPLTAPQNGTGNGAGWGVHLLLRPVDGDLIAQTYPEDGAGNVYRASSGGHSALLNYLGPDPNSYLSTGVYKTSNKTENDWTDIFNLTTAFSYAGPNSTYVDLIQSNINVLVWMRYFAFSTLSNDGETKMGNGIGDDYGLYRGLVDKRFVVQAHDFDTVFGIIDGAQIYATQTNSSIYTMLAQFNSAANMPLLRRFMTNNAFAPCFFAELKRIADNVLTPVEFGSLVDQHLSGWGLGPDAATIAGIKSYAESRRQVVLSQIPLTLTVGHTLAASGGYLFTTQPSATLYGSSHAIDTRRVLVNGVDAGWSGWEARWTNAVTLQSGINNVLIQSLDSNNVAFASTNLSIWYSNAAGTSVSGTLSGAPVWTVANSPYTVSGNLTVPAGVTLTILPGVTVYLASGVTITVNGTGKILAEGTAAQHIRMGKNPAASGNWGSLDFINTTAESRLAYIDFDSGGGTTVGSHNAQLHVNSAIVFIDHCTWPPTPVVEYISFDGSSFVVQNCYFPSYPPPTGPESLHGINGIPTGGYGIFRGNYFGHTWGFNDTIDFTGGNRPGAILQVIGNVFDGASDDCLDLDSTDAWIEGNIFMHVHRDPARTDQAIDTGSAISGGVDTVAQNSDWTVINNLFYDVDHVFLNKGNSTTTPNGGGRVAFLYNTVAHVAREYSGTTPAEIAVFDWSDDSITPPAPSIGSGMYAAHNIFVDAPSLQRFYYPTSHTVVFENNIFWQTTGVVVQADGSISAVNNPAANTDPLAGSRNQIIDPMLNLAVMAGVAPTNVTVTQLRAAFALRSGSPAAGAGFGGRNIGAGPFTTNTDQTVLANGLAGGPGGGPPQIRWPDSTTGIAINGDPAGTIRSTTVTVTVGPGGTFDMGTGAAQRFGWQAFRWNLDGGPWSPLLLVSNPPPFTNPAAITLSNLVNGPHTLFVAGMNDAGTNQDDAFVYAPGAPVAAHATASHTFIVDSGGSNLRLNEILASNGTISNHFGTTPDLIELFNAGAGALDLNGVSLTDDPADPRKFQFGAGTVIPGGGYLVVLANSPDGTLGIHTGFRLPQEGGALYLYDADANGGALIDSIAWGPQLMDYSIGRMGDGAWALTRPTFGGLNQAAAVGDPARLRINEWLALGTTPFDHDFIELYNADSLPVGMGGLFLTDETVGVPNRHQISPLSFIAANGYFRFLADGDAQQGAEHLNFSLGSEQGAIGLFYGSDAMGRGQTSLPGVNAPFTAIDCVIYQPARLNQSQGRSPNGGSAIVYFDTPSPGAPNPIVSGPLPFGGALVINEVLASNTGLPENVGTNLHVTPDWIELYNGTTNPVDLGNLSLTDDTLQPRRFVFSNSTVIAPAGFLRVLCDGNLPSAADSTGFGLKGSGGAVYLFDTPANGGTLLNSITYGIQTPNLSIGRLPDGGTNWVLCGPTPGAANFAIATLGDPATLRVNEWMASGAAGSDWFELYNPSGLPVALGGLYLTDKLNDHTKHRIASLSFLGGGTNAFQKFEADSNTGAGADHVGFSLNNAGEAIGIFSANGTLIDGVTFGAQTPGVSEGCFPDGSTNVVAFPGTVSPGESNYRLLTSVVINEALTHTDPPLEDAIELFNTTGTEIDVSGWWLSDDRGTLQKYQIPGGTVIPPHGFTVIYESHFTNRAEAAIPFALSSSGDEVMLSTASNNVLTGFRVRVDFGAAANGVSFGRYVTSDQRAEFVAMSARTFGADDPGSLEEFRTGKGLSNAYPQVGPVIISEIMYHPPDLGTNDNTRDEFIKLRNITTVPVPLFDSTNGWRVRNAVDFDFAPGTILPPGGTLLLVSFNPSNNPAALAAFRAQYGLDTNQPMVGPYAGKLANDTDDIELRRPDSSTNGGPSILVERVRYSDSAPWPAAADGTGYSLQRLSGTGFGNDPSNWVAAAAAPSPLVIGSDSDGDRMPDAWEISHGLDPFNPADAALDTDGDGLSNLLEYQLGTDPRDAASGLRLAIAWSNGTNLVVSFNAVSNFAYFVDSSTALGGSWVEFQAIASAPTNRLVSLPVPGPAAAGFYRLRLALPTGNGSLRIESIEVLPSSQVRLKLNIPAGLPCLLEQFGGLPAGATTTISTYPAAPTNRLLQIVVPAPGAQGFYRLHRP